MQQVTGAINLPVRYASADEPTLRGGAWIAQQGAWSHTGSDHENRTESVDEEAGLVSLKGIGWSVEYGAMSGKQTLSSNPMGTLPAEGGNCRLNCSAQGVRTARRRG